MLKRLIFISLTCLAFASSAQISPRISGGGPIIDSGPFLCDGKLRKFYWENPYDHPLKIVQIMQWVGFDYSLESDTQVETHLLNPDGSFGIVLAAQQLDNYKHRSFDQERIFNYLPSYIEIPVGGVLSTRGFCNKISGGNNAHFTVRIWHY